MESPLLLTNIVWYIIHGVLYTTYNHAENSFEFTFMRICYYQHCMLVNEVYVIFKIKHLDLKLSCRKV